MTTTKVKIRIAADQSSRFGRFLTRVFHGATGVKDGIEVLSFNGLFCSVGNTELRAYEGGQHLAYIETTKADFCAWVELIEESLEEKFEELHTFLRSEEWLQHSDRTSYRIRTSE